MIDNPLVHFLVGGSATTLIAFLGNHGYTRLGGTLGAMPILDLIPILFITVSATAAAETALSNAIVHVGTIVAMVIFYACVEGYNVSTGAAAGVAILVWLCCATGYLVVS